MIYIGDYFAIALVLILSLFYFEGKLGRQYLTKANKYFVACLLLTALTAAMDIFAGQLLETTQTPLWINCFVNTLYFVVNIVTTSAMALFLFTKILEHAYDNHCMRYACRALIALFVVYLAVLLLNLKTGWVFWFDQQGIYRRGVINWIGYAVTLCQMGLVLVCYCRNRKNASQSMRATLVRTFPVIVLSIIIQRMYPEIMLNGLIMAMMDTVLFLSFQGQRQGVHTLTKLNDRHRFFKDIEERMRGGETFQVFLVELKSFGLINRKYGHLLGDEILYQFAFALEKQLKGGTTFHMNGTDFALIIPYTSQTQAQENVNTLLGFLEQGVFCLNEQIHMEYVLVECLSDPTENDAAAFYEQMEYAAAVAARRKSRYIRCGGEMSGEMARTRYLIERLQKIDRAHGFQVWYQPIRCMETGEFSSMEALLRLQEPDGSIISPAEFIPLAEQTGVISTVTWFVLEEVCAFLSANCELDFVSVSVNLPMAQLLKKGFAAQLNGIVDSYGIAHRRICLEFTERAILDTFEQTKEVMENLRADGYRFYLDDFGAGYSNFNCLLQLPFQLIKLDVGLTAAEKNGESDYGLVHTLTELFHGMGLEVIAEGAESQEDVEYLRAQEIDRVQGYVYAKPMPEKEVLAFYGQSDQQ